MPLISPTASSRTASRGRPLAPAISSPTRLSPIAISTRPSVTRSIGRVSPDARKSSTMVADGVDHRLERLALAGEGDPADQLADPLGAEGVEHRVDHVALARLAAAALADRFGDRGRHGCGDVLGQARDEARRRDPK